MNAPTSVRELRSPPIFFWILIVGAAGFAAGFFGPIIFAPDANQGPLVGILISGPGGAVLGLILWAIFRAIRVSAGREWQALAVSSAILALVTLYFVMPNPELRGYVIDGQIQNCETPEQRSDAAIQDWERRFANGAWGAPRAGWKDDARRQLQADRGIVLDVLVLRANKIYEHRKAWDKGVVSATGWQSASVPRANEPNASGQKSYYVASTVGSCADYPVGSRLVRYSANDLSGLRRGAGDWPPRGIADFLDCQTFEPVPEKYRKFAGE